IKSPINDSVTHQSKYTISGRSPNGILNIFMDDTLINQLTVIDKSWELNVNLPEEKSYVFYTSMDHNELSRISQSSTLTRDPTPKITETSSSLIFNENFKLKGTGREDTLLTITIQETSLTLASSGISSQEIVLEESVVGQIITDEEGYWEFDLTMRRPGNYVFKVYENYNEENEVSSESYDYDLSVDSFDISLDIAPNPFNPNNEPLKIQYVLTESSDVTVEIYSISGQLVFSESLTNGMAGTSTGRHFIEWNGLINTEKVSPGLYIVILNVMNSNSVKTKRLGVKW
ncbi:MAG: T9SS type A sorting domain-containing protein, partial [Candidatus Margulisiibacteriota bacterium]|nr:T9SS type A sorting domain-containing protein [Candidatus Margulisiibacteriota bacterium]